ncbi:hypothetical protein Bca101_034324 [Brassica carinata]
MEKSNGLRVVLFPLPIQGCINPMFQLAKILHSREERKQTISCLIDDSGWIFTQPLAQSLNLSRFVLSTYKVSFFVGHFVLPKLRRERYLQPQGSSIACSEQDEPAEEFPPLRKKDLLRILDEETEVLDSYSDMILETTKASSGLVFVSSCEELDEDSLRQARREFQVPIFAIGPSHSYFPGSSSSLFTPDQTCIQWLDKQEDKAVIYVSFGSVVNISETELLEIAWGVRNSDQPFLWVVRVGMVNGTKWIEAIPEELMERLKEKGKIVKWAPQQDVLKHRATGGFLTHNGWNSTVESVCEGVPMICVPSVWDQLLNARFVSDVWMVGLHLEGRVERDEIERVVRKLLLEPEGEVIRERMQLLAEKVGRSVKQNGSAYRSLEHLVDHISSF